MLYEILNEKVQTNLPPCQDTSKKIIYTLAYFCDYISPIDIINLLGESISYHSYRQYFHEAVKDGLLKDHMLPTPCADIRKVYTLTDKGYKYTMAFLPNERKEKSKQKNTFLFHGYGAGLFFLSLLKSPYTFSYLQEKVIHGYYSTGTINRLRTLRIDAVYTLHTNKNLYTLYLEQDTGSEDIDTLFKKIELYVYHGLFKKESTLIFSFYKNAITIHPSFKVCYIKSIIKKLEHDDLQTLLSSNKLNGTEKEIALSLLSFLNCSNLTKGELNTYMQSLDNHTNPFFIRDKLNMQLSFFRHRRNSLFFLMKGLDIEHWVIKELLLGQQVWCDISYMPYIEPILYDGCYRQNIEHILKQFFVECDFSSCEDIHCFSDTKDENALPVYFRNVYSYQYEGEYNAERDDKTCYLAVENASHDLGGLIRAYYAIKGLQPNHTPLSLILITDTASDALYISKNLLQYCFGVNFLLKGRFHIYMIVRNDNRLFVADGRTGKVTLEPVTELW